MPLALLLAACSSSDGARSSDDQLRTVAVSMTDELRFEPDAFTVAAGETVRFDVTNEGQNVHEFLIGDEGTQAAFEEEMSNGEMDHATDAGVSLDPGEAGSFEYTFDESGDLLAGCHEPGHYASGMVASITVTD